MRNKALKTATAALVSVLSLLACQQAATADSTSPWLEVYGPPAADDLQRVTVDGSANATNYVRFTVDGNRFRGPDVLSREKVPFSS